MPLPVDEKEPERLAESIHLMKLKHCVITSVDRDDLPDGGANAWGKTIDAVREKNPTTTLEVLIPDFKGKKEDLQIILDRTPEIVSHNLETVRRLTPKVRSAAKYDRSLQVIKWIRESGIKTKSGLMVGLGETFREVLEAMDDLVANGCQVLTIGQYLQPTFSHIAVEEYIHPDVFAQYKAEGLKKGFEIVESGPLVRSSYHAEKHV